MPKSKCRRPDWTPIVEIEGHNGARCFRNSRYTVSVYEDAELIHLSIRHRMPGVYNYLIDWRDYQRIKNALAGPEREGIQLFPAESRLVDGAGTNRRRTSVSEPEFYEGRPSTQRCRSTRCENDIQECRCALLSPRLRIMCCTVVEIASISIGITKHSAAQLFVRYWHCLGG